jgi:DeoR/GlpR family transcriptional regulator of sugar metabolism
VIISQYSESHVASSRRIGDRAAFILEVIDRQGTATYEALAEKMRVSTMTVRRDCEELVRLGKIFKTIGGIQQAHAAAYLYENPARARIATNREEKRAIAAMSKVLDISQIHRVVTDERTRKSDLASLRRAGVKVEVASLTPMEHPQHAAYADR